VCSEPLRANTDVGRMAWMKGGRGVVCPSCATRRRFAAWRYAAACNRPAFTRWRRYDVGRQQTCGMKKGQKQGRKAGRHAVVLGAAEKCGVAVGRYDAVEQRARHTRQNSTSPRRQRGRRAGQRWWAAAQVWSQQGYATARHARRQRRSVAVPVSKGGSRRCFIHVLYSRLPAPERDGALRQAPARVCADSEKAVTKVMEAHEEGAMCSQARCIRDVHQETRSRPQLSVYEVLHPNASSAQGNVETGRRQACHRSAIGHATRRLRSRSDIEFGGGYANAPIVCCSLCWSLTKPTRHRRYRTR